MPKKLIKRYMPDPQSIREHRHLQIFGDFLHNPNLWHLNRRSASGAFAVGLFSAAIPIPFQMFLAAALAIVFRVNLPLSVALVWITNPLTMPPMFFIAYAVGAWILGVPMELSQDDFQLSAAWLGEVLGHIWQPFLLGCAVFAVLGALVGYFGIRLFWRFNVARQWEGRKSKRRNKATSTPPHADSSSAD